MLPFYKLSGAGNDFIALVRSRQAELDPSPEAIRAWCRRGLSVGADGLFVLERSGPGAARMTYFNADGGPAALCLNGTRCAARLAFELGWAEGGKTVTIETGAGRHRARRLAATELAVEVPPLARPPEPLEVEAEGRRLRGWSVAVGVPHFVLEWPEGLVAAPVETLGPLLRRHSGFGPAGTNVDFVRFGAAPSPGGRDRIEVRSYERGVEAETLACGTGVLAAAAVALALGRCRLPVAAATRGGFVLTVAGEPGEGGSPPWSGPRRWSLAGDARIVFEGRLGAEAAALAEARGSDTGG
jgi:diaminopimelate epimerase